MFKMILEDEYESLSELDLISVNGGNNGGGCTGGGAGKVAKGDTGSGSGGENPTAPTNTPSGGGGGGGSTSTSSGGCTAIKTDTETKTSETEDKSNESINKSEEKDLATVYAGKWAWVLGNDGSSNNYISDDYGETEDRVELAKIYGVSKFHHGIDLKADLGERINSVLDGTVSKVGYSAELGNFVVIKFEGGESIMYGHCDTIGVSEGQTVVAGEKVATVGMTGTSTGPHLHVAYDGNGDGVFSSETYDDDPARILFPGC